MQAAVTVAKGRTPASVQTDIAELMPNYRAGTNGPYPANMRSCVIGALLLGLSGCSHPKNFTPRSARYLQLPMKCDDAMMIGPDDYQALQDADGYVTGTVWTKSSSERDAMRLAARAKGTHVILSDVVPTGESRSTAVTNCIGATCTTSVRTKGSERREYVVIRVDNLGLLPDYLRPEDCEG